jgi:RES domain-containing protein
MQYVKILYVVVHGQFWSLVSDDDVFSFFFLCAYTCLLLSARFFATIPTPRIVLAFAGSEPCSNACNRRTYSADGSIYRKYLSDKMPMFLHVPSVVHRSSVNVRTGF